MAELDRVAEMARRLRSRANYALREPRTHVGEIDAELDNEAATYIEATLSALSANGRADTIEQCAKVAEDSVQFGCDCCDNHAWKQAILAIRALKNAKART